jgi:hypothetical protein
VGALKNAIPAGRTRSFVLEVQAEMQARRRRPRPAPPDGLLSTDAGHPELTLRLTFQPALELTPPPARSKFNTPSTIRAHNILDWILYPVDGPLT